MVLDRRSYLCAITWAGCFAGTFVLALIGTDWVNRCQEGYWKQKPPPQEICGGVLNTTTGFFYTSLDVAAKSLESVQTAKKPDAGTQQLIGMGIEFLGTTMSVIGLNGQKWALMQTKGQELPEGSSNFCIVRLLVWLRYNWKWACFFGVFASGQVRRAARTACAAVWDVAVIGRCRQCQRCCRSHRRFC